MPAISGIDHVALTVSDLDVSVAFYCAVLGVEVAGTMADGDVERRVLALPGPTRLGLTQHRLGSGRSFDPRTPGLDHLGLRCESLGELDAWVEHLDSLDISHSGVRQADYGRALSFKDPDGNALEMFLPA